MPTTTRKILITGVESTGKSTLAAALAAHYNTVWVREYAREYLTKLGREYEQADLLEIAQGQLALEAQSLAKAQQYLFCDTGMLVLKIWSEYKYGNCHPFILNELKKKKYDTYILCSPQGINWEYDPLREAPDPVERERLHQLYQQELQQLGIDYLVVNGDLEQRKQQVMECLNSWS